MSKSGEARSIIEAAEQAAGAGNYARAEVLLREAALLQEARLGPLHPDLANTLNNLGIVCEMNGKSGRGGAMSSPSRYHRDDGAGSRPSLRGHESKEPS